ncbi:hypothetical protein CAEBREN_23181 [Caenorhabditis brenneri]|uniref:Domain of unknown function WSN domain-containing protein n=1 Tax=Caenorhabditis brenneri TaxID=135651 RepID=G0NRI3_CAEBE|nr:hypothetical protein CAEBREN_23181 [Caenorhabditis brenneri]
MDSLTRLTNGIILEAGLIDGSISSDDVISDFLRTGSAKLEDLLKTDDSKLNTLISTLEAIQGSLSSTPEIKAVEKRFLALEEIRTKALDIGDVENLAGNDSYVKYVEQAKKAKTISKSLNDLFSELNFVSEAVKTMDKLTVNDTLTDDGDNKMGKIKEMINSLEKVKEDAVKLKSFLHSISQLKGLKSVDFSFLQPLFKEEEVRKKYIKDLASGSKIVLALISDNVQKLQNASKVFTDSSGLLTPLLNIVTNKMSTVSLSIHGFSNGYDDLLKLPEDAESADLRGLCSETESDWVSKHLATALLLMADFGKNISEFDKKWEIFTKQSSLDALNYVIKTQEDIGKLADKKDIQLEKLKKFERCDEFSEDPKMKVESLDTIRNIQNEKAKLDALVAKFKSFESLDKLPDFSKLKPWNGKKTITEDELETFKSLYNRTEISNSLTTLRKDFNEFQKNIPIIEDLIPKISYSHIDNYQQSLIKSGYLTFYSCLTKDIGEDGSHALGLLTEIQKVRRHGKDGRTQESKEIVDQFSKSLEDLKTLRQSGIDMKTITDTEAIALKDSMSKDGQKSIQQLSELMKGLEKVLKVSENQKGLESLLVDISFVAETAEKEKSKLKPEEYQELSKLENLKSKLAEVFVKIKNLEESIASFEPTNFNSLKPIFEAAGEIPEFTEDVKQMESSLEALKKVSPTLQGNITAIIDSLKLLETLDLKFSAYPFKTAEDVLKALDTFFADFSRKIPPPPTEPPTSTLADTPQTTPFAASDPDQIGVTQKQVASTTEKSMPEWQIGVIVAVCLIVAAAIILGILSYFRGWFCFKNHKSKTSSTSDSEPVIILPPLPPVHAAESLYIPPPSTYQQLPIPPPPPPSTGQPKADAGAVVPPPPPPPPSTGTSQPGPQDFPQATITVEPTQENEVKTKTVDETGNGKSKETTTKSKESASKGSKSTSKEDMRMKPSHEV